MYNTKMLPFNKNFHVNKCCEIIVDQNEWYATQFNWAKGKLQEVVFLKFWLGGIRWYKVRHTASNNKNVERSSCFVSSVPLRPIISNNPTNYYQTISTYVQTIKLQKVPKMPNKSLQYFGTFHWTFCVSYSFSACSHLPGQTL